MGTGVDLDLPLVVAGLVIGIVVGMTGMGGGALMTPCSCSSSASPRSPPCPATSSPSPS